MANALEELTADTLSPDEVARRVADWKRRIENLYAEIVVWLEPEWVVVPQRRHVRMFEKPMREVGLEAADLPRLDLAKNGQWSLAFVPHALWIIGANGRIDVTRPEQMLTTHFIVDAAENFEPPQWRIVSLDDRGTRRPLDRSTLRSVI